MAVHRDFVKVLGLNFWKLYFKYIFENERCLRSSSVVTVSNIDFFDITVIFELLLYCDDLDQILTIENQCHDIFLWLRPPAKILRCHSWREINLIMYLQLNNSGIYCHLMKCAKRIWMMITWQSAVWEDDLSFSQWKI